MMPLLTGIDAAQQIVEACTETQVVMLTALEQERLVTDAVQAGVRGFVLKTQAGEDLAQAIQQGSRGGFYVGDRESTRLNSSHGYISYSVFFFEKKKKQLSRKQLPRRTKQALT